MSQNSRATQGSCLFSLEVGCLLRRKLSECEAGSCLVNSWHTNGDCYMEAGHLNPKPEVGLREPDPRTIQVMGALCLCCLVWFSLLPLLSLHQESHRGRQKGRQGVGGEAVICKVWSPVQPINITQGLVRNADYQAPTLDPLNHKVYSLCFKKPSR